VARAAAYLHAKFHLDPSYSPGELVSWSLTSLFSTDMAISETNIRQVPPSVCILI